MTRSLRTPLRKLGLALGLALLAPAALADQAADVDALIRQLAPVATQQESAGPAPESVEVHGKRIWIVPYHRVDLEVYFAFDSYELTWRAQQDLTALGYALASPQLRPHRYLIAGHTDATGDAGHNQWLSERRAEAVVRFLVNNFPIEPYRLLAVGWGESRLKTPATPNAAINRRVEVVLMLPVESNAPVAPEVSPASPPAAAAPPAAAPETPLPGTITTDKDGKVTITW